jgi:hypothetical protein
LAVIALGGLIGAFGTSSPPDCNHVIRDLEAMLPHADPPLQIALLYVFSRFPTACALGFFPISWGLRNSATTHSQIQMIESAIDMFGAVIARTAQAKALTPFLERSLDIISQDIESSDGQLFLCFSHVLSTEISIFNRFLLAAHNPLWHSKSRYFGARLANSDRFTWQFASQRN